MSRKSLGASRTRFARAAWIAAALGTLPGPSTLLWSDGPTPTAEYTARFDATWSAATHPISFPANAHFSGLIGGTHTSAVTFWAAGGIASQGIENMAEIGSKTPLDAEVQAAITAGTADGVISGGGISPSPGSVSVSFTMDQDFPLVTLVSMIAPSPDWFVGVAGLALFEDGNWVNERVVQLLPYDAGTDSGITYTSPNQDTNPQDPIAVIVAPPAGNGVPFGTFTFTRTDVPSVPATSGWILAVGAIVLAAAAMGSMRRLAGIKRRA
jgi:hypothetical protein